jgi:RHS repeat-associated protein
MQPSLALSYNSQSGRGIVGTGWSLSGFSTIHRCPASIVIDGFKGKIEFDENDRFCLDGMRLIAIAGADGAGGSEYRTERDSYSKIIAFGGSNGNPTSWTVTTKAGQTLTFGQPLYWSTGSGYSTAKTKAWGVTRVVDTVSNYMDFAYRLDHERGWMLPETVSYTGNTAAAAVPYATVSISYDNATKLDTSVIYDGTGSYGQTPPLVSSITSKVGTSTAYQVNLAYEESTTTGRVRLTSAQLCGSGTDVASGLCMESTKFTYNDAKVNTATPWVLANPSNIGFTLDAGAGRNMLALDRNGDGKTEILQSNYFYTSATGIFPYVAWTDPQPGDFNGDGLVDTVFVGKKFGEVEELRIVVCIAQPIGSSQPFGCSLMNWGEEETDPNTGLPSPYWSFYSRDFEGSITGLKTPGILVGDFDGDGKSDALLSTGRIYLAYGQTPQRVRKSTGLAFSFEDVISSSNPITLGDFDGDGRLDVAKIRIPNSNGFSSWDIWLSQVKATDNLSTAANAFVSRTTDGPRRAGVPQPHVADLNGDGLADLLADAQPQTPAGANLPEGWTPYADNTKLFNMFRWHGCLSKGDGTMDCSVWRGPWTGETEFRGKKYGIEVLGDFNGDGRTDLAIYDVDASDANSDTGGRYVVCVSRPSFNPESLRGLFDCSPSWDGGVAVGGKTSLIGGGLWAGGIRRNTQAGVLRYDQIAAGDFLGDGRTGMAGGTPVSLSACNTPCIMRPNVQDTVANIPDMLASVTNGLGFKSLFKYKPITDTAIYTKEPGTGAYPILNIQTAMYVATEVSHDNGLAGSGQTRYTYKYEGLKGHTTGGGTLGFAKVIVKDEQSGIVTETTYNNGYPQRGLVTGTIKKQANGTLLNRSSTTYKFVQAYPARPSIHAYLQETVTEESWGLNGTAVLPKTETVTTYDDAAGSDNEKYGCAKTVTATTYAPSSSVVQFKKTNTNTYDNTVSNWRLCRLTSASVTSEQTVYTADTAGSIAASETRNSSFTYNASTGLLQTETVQSGGAQEITLTTTYTHDAFGNRTRADVVGWNDTPNETRTSKTTYDTRGRFAISSENALGHTEQRTFDSVLGTMLTLTGPNNLVTTQKYDKLGRKVTEIRPDGTKTAMSYETGSGSAVVVVRTKVTGGGETIGETDKLGREIRKGVKISDNGTVRWSYVSTVYDARGRVDQTSRPYYTGATPIYPVARKYDNLDRVEEETLTNDDGTITKTSTTYNGLTTTVTVTGTDAAGASSARTSTTVLDSRGMTQSVTNTQGNTVEHKYDAAGNLVRTTRTVGAAKMVTKIDYDLRGRKTALSDPDTGAFSYAYNAFGELISQTDAKNQQTITKYDKLGRVTQRASGTDLTSDYTYDACTKGKGKLCSVTAKGLASPSGSASVGYTRTLTYDSVGRMSTETSVIGGRTFTASTTYDAAGRVKTITYPNGQFATRGYDAVGAWNRLIGAGGKVLWQGGAADAEARWRTWTLGNGLTTSTAFGANTGRLSTLTTTGNVQSLALTYDGFGNIKTRLDAVNNYQQSNGTAETYRYDTLNQLTQANILEGAQNISYDGFGRIVTKTGVNAVAGTYQYYGLTTNGSTTSNRVQAANNRNYTYDANGNVETITGTAAGTITLSWTSFNQPMTLPVAASNASVAGVGGNPNCFGQIVICFKYGPDNERRIEYLPPDSAVAGANQGSTRYHLHAGASLFYEEDVRADSSREQRVYLAGPLGIVALHTTNADSAGNPIVPSGGALNAQNNNGTPYTLTYWHRDHLGSLTVTTDDAGAVRERMRYDPWGKPQTNLASKTRSGDRGFTGHEHLAGGLIHMNGRIYDPVLGRFLSADIVVQFPDAITSYNRYAYVMNNPMAYTDPSGYFIQFIAAALISYGVPTFLAYASAIAFTGGVVAAATGHQTAARRFFAAAIMFATAGIGGEFGGVIKIAGAFAAGGVQSGSIEGAIMSAFSAAFFSMAGEISDVAMFNEAALAGDLSPGAINASAFNIGGIGRAGMHFGAGAMRAMMTDQNPLRGGFSAGFAEIAGPYVSGTELTAKQFAAHVIAGGIGEQIAGGKFANGALTGAFAWLYNHFSAHEAAGKGLAISDAAMKSAGWEIAGKEISFRDAEGVGGRIDRLYKDPSTGRYLAVEVKYGESSDWTKNQRKYMQNLDQGKITFHGENAARAGLKIGVEGGGIQPSKWAGAAGVGYGGSKIENTARAQQLKGRDVVHEFRRAALRAWRAGGDLQ